MTFSPSRIVLNLSLAVVGTCLPVLPLQAVELQNQSPIDSLNLPLSTPILKPSESVSSGDSLTRLSQSSSTHSCQDAEISSDTFDKITISGFIFENATVYTRRTLEEVVKEALKINKFPACLTFAQLLKARSAVTGYYIKNGYITSGAYLPEQNFKQNGTITIRVLEGKLEDVKVNSSGGEGAKFDACIERQLTTTKPLNQNRLLEDLRLLRGSDSRSDLRFGNEFNPRVERLEARLEPGSTAGRNQLIVEVARKASFVPEFKDFSWRSLDYKLYIDNDQSPSTGEIGRRLEIILPNFASVAFTQTDGSTAFDADVLLPELNAEDEPCHSVDWIARFGFKASKVITQPFNQLDIQTASAYVDVTRRQAVQISPSKRFSWGATASYRQSDTSLLGIPLPLASDAGTDGVSRTVAIRPFAELMQRGSASAFSSRRAKLGSRTKIFAFCCISGTSSASTVTVSRFFARS